MIHIQYPPGRGYGSEPLAVVNAVQALAIRLGAHGFRAQPPVAIPFSCPERNPSAFRLARLTSWRDDIAASPGRFLLGDLSGLPSGAELDAWKAAFPAADWSWWTGNQKTNRMAPDVASEYTRMGCLSMLHVGKGELVVGNEPIATAKNSLGVPVNVSPYWKLDAMYWAQFSAQVKAAADTLKGSGIAVCGPTFHGPQLASNYIGNFLSECKNRGLLGYIDKWKVNTYPVAPAGTTPAQFEDFLNDHFDAILKAFHVCEGGSKPVGVCEIAAQTLDTPSWGISDWVAYTNVVYKVLRRSDIDGGALYPMIAQPGSTPSIGTKFGPVATDGSALVDPALLTP